MIRTGKGLAALVVSTALLMSPTSAWSQSEWKAPAEAKTLKNPVQGDGDAKKVIATSCAACHGSSGRGDGVASAALQPKPVDWSSAAVQSDTDGELFWKITNGRGSMPAWRQLPETERWQIVNYIRTLRK
jgi:mono/diheme cytochrome c family protein